MIDIKEAEAKLRGKFVDDLEWAVEFDVDEKRVQMTGEYYPEEQPQGVYYMISIYDNSLYFDALIGFLEDAPSKEVLETINKYNNDETYFKASVDEDNCLALTYSVYAENLDMLTPYINIFFNSIIDDETIGLYNDLKDYMKVDDEEETEE